MNAWGEEEKKTKKNAHNHLLFPHEYTRRGWGDGRPEMGGGGGRGAAAWCGNLTQSCVPGMTSLARPR